MKTFNRIQLITLMTLMIVGGTAWAQDTLEGLPKVNEWTDLETTADDLPAEVWGNCDDIGADSVGIRVEFDDGTTASAVYSNLADKWNSNNDGPQGFDGLVVGPATGFLASCPELHYLYNDGTTLPMAWNDCSAPAANNFDLDYNEANGSNFRASTSGWVSAHFQTYCGNGLGAQPVPVNSPLGLALAVLALTALGFVALRRHRQLA